NETGDDELDRSLFDEESLGVVKNGLLAELKFDVAGVLNGE
ncbi:unnamed protein product, partial [Rotaria magnacalcarata]